MKRTNAMSKLAKSVGVGEVDRHGHGQVGDTLSGGDKSMSVHGKSYSTKTFNELAGNHANKKR